VTAQFEVVVLPGSEPDEPLQTTSPSAGTRSDRTNPHGMPPIPLSPMPTPVSATPPPLIPLSAIPPKPLSTPSSSYRHEEFNIRGV
jgi:hypothetical protein